MCDDWKLSPEEIDSLEAGMVNKATTGDAPTFEQMAEAAEQMRRTFDEIRKHTALRLQQYFDMIGFETWVPVEEIAAALLSMGIPSDTGELAQNMKRATEVVMMGYMSKAPYKGGAFNVERLAPMINTPEFTVPASMIAKHQMGGDG